MATSESSPVRIKTACATAALCVAVACAAEPFKNQWPSFRGFRAAGVDDTHPTPTTWNVARAKNIKWKTPIPGLGHSSPVVWNNRVFVTTSISGRDDPTLVIGLYGDIAPVNDTTVHTWWVYCLDAGNGRVVWKRKSHESVPAIKRHTKSTHANSTPATNGQYVVAFFGSEGLYCYDMHGKLLWKKDLGRLDAGFYMVPDAQWGFGSSPILTGQPFAMSPWGSEGSWPVAR